MSGAGPPPFARRRVAPSTNKGEARDEVARVGAQNDAKELTSAKRLNGSTLLETLYYGYDKAGNRTQVGTGTTAPKNYETNNLNQLLSERDHGKTTFAGFVDEPATVTVNGQPAKVLSTDGGAPFKFEGIVNLDAGANTVVVEAKDGQNNTSTKSYSVTTTGNAKTFEYDANGNLRFEKLPGGSVVREYRWDQQNRLVRAIIGTHESVYEYDGESKRVRIKELMSSVETKNETFVWCGSRICQKRAANGSTVVRNYFQQGFEEGTTDSFYTRDHLGSVREVVESDGSTVGSRLHYDPWGSLTETGPGALSDFTFTGHHYDRPTQLTLTWYRAYDPARGRWLNQDPIHLKGGTNVYAYVNNSPINLRDLLGLTPTECTLKDPCERRRLCFQRCADERISREKQCDNESDPTEKQVCYATSDFRESACRRDCFSNTPDCRSPY